MLTLRNWLVSYYIVEYEQKGQDRAKYGEGLLESLSQELKTNKLKRLSQRNLYLFKEFYLTYPQILQILSAKLQLTDFQDKIPKQIIQ